MNNSKKKTFTIHPEAIERKLEELELEIFDLEERMEKETDLIILQQYQDEWNRKEEERTSLYQQLEDVL